MFTKDELKDIAEGINGKKIDSKTKIEAFAFSSVVQILIVEIESEEVLTELSIKKNGDYQFDKNKRKYVKQIMKVTDLVSDIIAKM